MPQLTSAATYHGRSARFCRWAYQANVMKTFEQTSSSAARYTTSVLIAPPGTKLPIDRASGPGHDRGDRGHVGLRRPEIDDAGAQQEAAVDHRVGDEDLAAQLEAGEQD